MVLLKNGHRSPDVWRHLNDDENLPDGPATVTLERWYRERDRLSARNTLLGLQLGPGDDPLTLAEDVHRFSVICLQFESFADGRPYSQARLLRERLNYRGEIRAQGNVLRDQFEFMRRCGIDTVEVEKETDALAWREAVSEIDIRFQPAADTAPTAAMYRRGAAAGYPI